jgi:hypothetical protein
MSRLVCIMVVGWALVGCGGGGSGDDAVAADDNALSAAGPSTKLEFHCVTTPHSDDDMDISLERDTLEWDDGTKGTLDPTFHPTTNTDFVRYLGFATSEGPATMLIQKPILKGQTGTAKLEFTGESFSSTTLTCTKK